MKQFLDLNSLASMSVIICHGMYMLTIFALQPILACIIWKVKASWPSCWPICPLVYLRHLTSTLILCGCLAPWSVEESDWVDWGNPEMSSPHRLSHYSIYALLGGTSLLHYADLPSLSDRRDKLCHDFFQKLRHLLPPAHDRPHLPAQKSIYIP